MLDSHPSTCTDMAAKERSFYELLGARLAQRRRTLNLTQVDLAAKLGIAQQTMAHYEGGVSRIAVETLSQAANVLHTTVEDLIGAPAQRNGKRGPAPKLQTQIERIATLPRSKQRMLIDMLDAAINSTDAQAA